jgi:ribose transport system permease protein
MDIGRIASTARRSPVAWVWVVVVILLGTYLGVDPGVLKIVQLQNFALELSPYVFTAFAQTLVMLTAGIDLSVGATVSLTTAVVAKTGSVEGAVLALAIGVLIGLVNGAFVSVGKVPAIIVTLASSFIISGAALLVLPTPGGSVPQALVKWGGATAGLPVAIWSWVISVAVWGWFKRTPKGRSLYAVGDSVAGARAAGLRVTELRLIAYGIGGLFAALGGLFLAIQTGGGDPTVGTPYTLSSIAAAVVGGVSFFGGRGTLRGTLGGAIIVGALTSVLFFLGVSQFAQYVVEGGVLIAALVIANIQGTGRAAV